MAAVCVSHSDISLVFAGYIRSTCLTITSLFFLYLQFATLSSVCVTDGNYNRYFDEFCSVFLAGWIVDLTYVRRSDDPDTLHA